MERSLAGLFITIVYDETVYEGSIVEHILL